VYRDFFGFDDKPFGKTPDPAFFFPSRIHEEALARLQYGAEERELVLLTGEIGSGKTLLTRALIDQLGDSYRCILLINPRLTPNQFLRILASRLGIKGGTILRVELVDRINEALFSFFEKGICPVVIIDEAQLIPTKATFDEIRLLTNFQLDDVNLLSLILVGQPELKRRLRQPAFEALRQRIGIQFHLGALGREDTGKYIASRLDQVGGDTHLFDEEALDVIYGYSGGLPRLINNISSNALLAAFSKELLSIGPDIVLDVIEELDLEPRMQADASACQAGGNAQGQP